MKYFYSLLICILLTPSITSQVFIQELHYIKSKPYSVSEIGFGKIYNHLHVTIEGKLDIKIYTSDKELVFHKQSTTQKFISGKTDIQQYNYTNATTFVDKLDKVDLKGLNVEFSLLHPNQTSSIICQRKFNTDIYDPELAAPVYIIANGLEITTREKQVQTQGTELEYKIVVHKRAKRAFDLNNCSIDYSKSNLNYMTDNSGYNYIAMNDHEKSNRMTYIRKKAKEGTFYSQPEDKGFLYDKAGFKREGDDFVFKAHAVGIPSMATNIYTEGRITLLEHTEEVIEEIIEVKLKKGELVTINGKNVTLESQGRGMDGNGPYAMLKINTPLKVKSIQLIDEPDQENKKSVDYFTVRPSAENEKIKARVLYYKAIEHLIEFKTEFNLNMSYDIKTKDNHTVNQHIVALKVSREKPQIEAELALQSPDQIYNSRKSTITLTDMEGRSVNLGKVRIKEKYLADGNPTLIIENVPPKETANILAKIKLAKVTTSKETEDIILKIGRDKKASNLMIDGYELGYTHRANGNILNYSAFVVTNNPNHFVSNGLMGRKILDVVIESEDGANLTVENKSSDFSLPNDDKAYTVTFKTQSRKVTYETIETPIGIGYGIHHMSNRAQPNYQTKTNDQAKTKQKSPNTVKKSANATAQNEPAKAPVKNPDIHAHFSACDNAGTHVDIINCSNEKLKEYIYSHPEYKLNASANPTQRGIYQFTVENNGYITNIRTIRSAGPPRDKAAISIINSIIQNEMKWTPAIHNGQNARQEFTLPIKW